MDFITSSIISGIIYDLVKKGVNLSLMNVFGNTFSNNLDYKVSQKFLDEINQIKDTDDKIAYSNKLLKEENEYTTMFERQMYTTNFAKRLDYIILLMNDNGKFNEKINLEKMGEYLGFKSVNDLKRYYLSSEEPEYSFIEIVAYKLGISDKWLKFGEGEPFETTLPSINRALGIISHESFDETKEFIFVIGDEPYRRNLGIIRKLSKFKYDYYPHTLVFHADVGGTGGSELFSVYLFLKELRKRRKMPSGVYKVPSDKFDSFFKGTIYPGTINNFNQDKCNYLLDDFIDLYNTEDKKENYKKLYGKVFVDCQDLIKYRLEENE